MNIEITYLADQLHHADELARLHDVEWGHLHPRIPVETRADRLRQASGRREIPTVLIAVDGPQLVGSVALVRNDMDDRPHLSPWLAAVYVKPDRRRGGIASRLLARVEDEGAALGVSTIYLFTEHEERFYGRRGWRLMERVDYHGTHVSVMSKPLPGVGPSA